MEFLSGAQMLIHSLIEEGVDRIFGYPGGTVLHIYDALFQQNKIEHILVRHEQAATHMADGYARITGKPGVVLVTSGPGATNAITGIATANMDSVPMIIISGQVVSSGIGSDMFQEVDMMGISRPIVKHSFLVQNPKDIPRLIKKAFYLSQTGRPGPIVIDIPKDMTDPKNIFEYQYPKSIQMRSYSPSVDGHPSQIAKAIKTLTQANKPIIYAGGGIILGQASKQLTQLARKLNLPVTLTLNGLGGFPGSDPQFLGMLGMHGSLCANEAMHKADVIFAIGVRFDDRVTNNLDKFCPDATIIHVDIDPASISKTVTADIPIVGAVDTVLNNILLQLESYKPKTKDLTTWWQEINEWRKDGLFTYDKGDGSIIKPQQVIEALHLATKGDAFVTSDVGQHQMFAAQYYTFDLPNRWINSGGLGTMGFGFPAAMGIQCTHPDAVVACVTGEGSIQMNIQELSTCKQYGLNVKIININNGSLGMVRQWQDMQYEGRHSESYVTSLPDFVKLAEAYGHIGMKVVNPSDLEPTMKEAFSLKDRLVFLDIQVDPLEHVYPMQIKGGCVRDLWINKEEKTI